MRPDFYAVVNPVPHRKLKASDGVRVNRILPQCVASDARRYTSSDRCDDGLKTGNTFEPKGFSLADQPAVPEPAHGEMNRLARMPRWARNALL